MRKIRYGALVGALVTALVLAGGVAPAQAVTGAFSSSQGGYSTIYYGTARTNVTANSAVLVRITNDGTHYSPTFTVGLRSGSAHSGVWARTPGFKQSNNYTYVLRDSNKSRNLGRGTFYTSVSVDGCMGQMGDCFGTSTGFSTWSGNISWSVPSS
jgi:hypothetical protein